MMPKGSRHTLETRHKMRRAHTGKRRGPLSEAQKQKMRDAMMRGWDTLSYNGKHQRVHRLRGPARDHPCAHCGTVEGRREWANISGRHRDELDYVVLCAPCHRVFDWSEPQS